MRKINALLILSLTTVVLALVTVPAMAATYTIDGDLADWGLDAWNNGLNNGGASYWVPDSSTCYFVVEDNRDPDRTESEYFWPEYGSTPISGVHIIKQGTSTTYVDYDEPLINGDAQPSGAEICDIEALYFDSDATNVYFAIITSIPPENMGDLKITLDSMNIFGVVLPRSETSGTTTNVNLTGSCDWDKCGNVFNPWPAWCNPLDISLDFRVKTGTPTGTASVAYINAGDSYKDNAHDYTGKLPEDFDGSNWVIEICVPRSTFGLNPSGGELDLHATLWCGNDLISIGQAHYFEVPEFTTIAVPICMILGMFYFFRRKRQNEGE